MNEQFEKLAKEIPNCTFSYKDYKVLGRSLGARYPASLYQLRIEYQNHIIIAENELGHTDLGRVVTVINNDRFPAFELETRNKFFKLFSRNKTTFVIKSENDSLKNFIEQRIRISGIDQIEEENVFEPQMRTELKEGKTVIITTYHMQFVDKIGAIHALIKFYQGLIDFSIRRN